jgi:hypothetical protein
VQALGAAPFGQGLLLCTTLTTMITAIFVVMTTGMLVVMTTTITRIAQAFLILHNAIASLYRVQRYRRAISQITHFYPGPQHVVIPVPTPEGITNGILAH